MSSNVMAFAGVYKKYILIVMVVPIASHYGVWGGAASLVLRRLQRVGVLLRREKH
jgi:ribosomal protein S25